MKKILLLTILAGLLTRTSAQPTQAEIDKKLKEAQAMIDKINADPKTKAAMKSMPNMDSIMKATNKNPPMAAGAPMPMAKKDTSNYKLPPRNTKNLNALPNHVYSKSEFVSYISRLSKVMSSTLASSMGTRTADVSKADAATLRQAAVVAWAKGEADQAVLLALNAVEKNPMICWR